MKVEDFRGVFEARCVEQLLVARAAAQAHGQTLPDDNGGATVESLCWREQDGRYGVLQLNAAWIGFQWGLQAAAVVAAGQPAQAVCEHETCEHETGEWS